MKPKINARQKREAQAQRRKGALKQPAAEPEQRRAAAEPARKPVLPFPEPVQAGTPEDETRVFLEYLERYDTPADKDGGCYSERKGSASGPMAKLNLEKGMPFVEEALDRLNLGLQEMRYNHEKTVKLIHGYGSTGRGGKIRTGVRNELADMKRRKMIREYIPGEDFGPLDASSRKLAEQDKRVTRDPDYGRMNHGITIVVL